MTQSLEVRHAVHPEHVKTLDTAGLRRHFLIEDLFRRPDHVRLVYSHYERMIVGGAVPMERELRLETPREVGAPAFLARRELAVINIGAPGRVTVGGAAFDLAKGEAVYAGLGAGEVTLASRDAGDPARFYLLSTPAHRACPTVKLDASTGRTLSLGSAQTANARDIHQMLIPGAVESCQLVFGITRFKPGSVWNTMPPHVHDRRNEVYLYFDIAEGQRVVHLMGEPQETRHVLAAEGDAVISPPWSIHSGVGTGSYAFIWAMGGDNQDYADMDMLAPADLR
jgi:4-deoxy-L-threo-5-hexosulose-uronate ketol-isomerase